MSKQRNITVETLLWEGITIEVSYEAGYFMWEALAHLQVRAISPEQQPLPMTETGYRSHFISRSVVDASGGPVAYVRAWLDTAAETPEWRRMKEAARQLSLF